MTGVPPNNKQLQRAVTRIASAAQARHFIVRSRRAGGRSARPLSCGVIPTAIFCVPGDSSPKTPKWRVILVPAPVKALAG
jgi:hypothetical protein